MSEHTARPQTRDPTHQPPRCPRFRSFVTFEALSLTQVVSAVSTAEHGATLHERREIFGHH